MPQFLEKAHHARVLQPVEGVIYCPPALAQEYILSGGWMDTTVGEKLAATARARPEARQYGVAFVPLVSYDSSRANKGVLYAQDRESAQSYVSRLWQEVYGSGKDMSSDEVLSGIAAQMRWDASDFLRFVSSPEAELRLSASNQRAHEAGIFGVPTMIADGEMWWGNDRLELMCGQLGQARA